MSRPSARALAAIAYLAYGLVYLLGAWSAMTPERRDAGGPVPWWVFFVAGAALVAALPPLVWRGPRWIALVLAALVSVKALTLWWRAIAGLRGGGERVGFHLAFAMVATITAVLLARAGAGRRPR